MTNTLELGRDGDIAGSGADPAAIEGNLRRELVKIDPAILGHLGDR